MATTHHQDVSLVGHDCPTTGQILCFRIDCRHCGTTLAEHAPVEGVYAEIRTLLGAHDCASPLPHS